MQEPGSRCGSGHEDLHIRYEAEYFSGISVAGIRVWWIVPAEGFAALGHRAKELDLDLPLLESVLPSNAQHIDRAVDAVLRTNKKKIAFLGLSFKPGTDDLRESPQVQMIKRLLGEGCQVRVWDRDVSAGTVGWLEPAIY